MPPSFREDTMNLLICALLLVPVQDKKAEPPKCECGATFRLDGDKVVLMFKDKEIASTPLVFGRFLLGGKEIDVSKPGALKCPCGKSVKLAAALAPSHWTGSTVCSGCGCTWTVTDTNANWAGGKFASAAFAHDYPIKNNKAKIGKDVDFSRDKSFPCLCTCGNVPIGEAKEKKDEPKKAGKKLGEAACACGAKLTFFENVAKLEWNKMDLAVIPVADGKVQVASQSIDLKMDVEVACLCGKKVNVAAMLK